MPRAAATSISDYASESVMRKLAQRVRACDIEPVGVELRPGGVIRFLGADAFPVQPRDEFEKLEAEGKLG